MPPGCHGRRLVQRDLQGSVAWALRHQRSLRKLLDTLGVMVGTQRFDL
jgi:hypothetical protein